MNIDWIVNKRISIWTGMMAFDHFKNQLMDSNLSTLAYKCRWKILCKKSFFFLSFFKYIHTIYILCTFFWTTNNVQRFSASYNGKLTSNQLGTLHIGSYTATFPIIIRFTTDISFNRFFFRFTKKKASQKLDPHISLTFFSFLRYKIQFFFFFYRNLVLIWWTNKFEQNSKVLTKRRTQLEKLILSELFATSLFRIMFS